MNWFKKKAFGWLLKFLKNKIKGSNPEINALYVKFYGLSIQELLADLTSTLAHRDLSAITFTEYLKEINNPLRDDIEEWIDSAIDGLDPRS